MFFYTMEMTVIAGLRQRIGDVEFKLWCDAHVRFKKNKTKNVSVQALVGVYLLKHIPEV